MLEAKSKPQDSTPLITMDTNDMASSSSSRFISHIIYPDVDLSSLKSDAYLIGWNLDSFRCSIACIVPIASNKLSDLSEALRLSSHDLVGVLSSCSKHGRSPPIVLGELLISNDRAYIPSPEKQARGIWITLCYDRTEERQAIPKPKLHSLYSLSCRYETSVYIFRYKRAQSQKLECFFVKRTYRNQKLKHDTKSEVSPSNSPKSSVITDLEVILGHINTANELRNRLDFYLDTAAGRPTNVINYYDAQHPFTSSTDQYFSRIIGYICTGMARVVAIWCAFLKLLTQLLNHRFELLRLGSGISQWLGLSGIGSIETSTNSGADVCRVSNGAGQGITMRDLSLTSAFVSERASMCSLAVQKCALFPLAWNLPCAMKQRLWLEVHALVLLIWVDVFLGMLLGYFIFTHAETIVLRVGLLCRHVQSTYILETLEWFNHLPGGVKLNTTITQRMSSLLTAVVHSFDWCLHVTRPAHCGLLRFIACCGGFGCSVQLVMLVDLMRMLSLHIALIHRVLSFLHHFLLQCLHSLWLLFNGQKNNILRKRIDTVFFGQDQLLIGIVLFSIVFFVFPNFAAYFFLFAVAQFVCVAMQYVLYSLSVLLKEFPYYEAVMFITCPGIMSDGVQFSILPQEARPPQESCELGGDNFNINCLWNSWQAAFSAPIVAPSDVPSRRAQSSRTSGDARRASESTHASSRDLELPTLTSRIISNNTIASTSTSTATTARPKGILKSTDRNQSTESLSSAYPPLSGRTERVGRVSFQGNTVRTIEQYTSEGESGHSGEDEYRKNTDNTAEAKQNWESRMSLLQSQRKPVHHSAHSRSTISKSKNSATIDTAYIELRSRPMSKASLFVAYFNHMFYFSNERGVMYRLLKGIVSGRPALDIQLIHGTSDIADRREATEKALMQEVVSLAAASAEARREEIEVQNGALSPSQSGTFKRIRFPRSIRALKVAPSFAESIDAAWAGNERRASEDPVDSGSTSPPPSPHTRDNETDALLSGESSPNGDVQSRAPVPRSVHCRTLSRRMLFILLATLCVNFLLSMSGMLMFFAFNEFRSNDAAVGTGGKINPKPLLATGVILPNNATWVGIGSTFVPTVTATALAVSSNLANKLSN